MGKQIKQSTLAILSNCRIDGYNVYLPAGQLDRKEYVAVNEVLENIGGKWKSGKVKAHVFSDDPTDLLEAVLLTGEITLPKKYGYFPTPPALAKRVVELADMVPNLSVLEPSAGQAGIADFIPKDTNIFCVELLENNIKVLKDKGYTVIHEGDFLSLEPTMTYDRVIMNPPFEKQADIDHVLHAWKFVKPNGCLVSIMSAGFVFRENSKSKEFRTLVEQYGFYENNPEGSFKESGTMVNTVTVVLRKH